MVPIVRYLGVIGLAFWVGGIAFYGGLVIPRAHEILDSHREVGFVTRQVTGTANVLGAVVLAVLLAHLILVWKRRGKGDRIMLTTSWGLMAAALIALIVIRSSLDGMLDPSALKVVDRPRFVPLHERYLNGTSILTLAALVHLWAMIKPVPSPGV